MSSSEFGEFDQIPLIGLVYRANRAFQNHMWQMAAKSGMEGAKPSFNIVFATLPWEGARAADMAAQAGVTRQSMGEVIREMVDLGLLEMRTDPTDRRAKLVTYTDEGAKSVKRGNEHLSALERRFAQTFGAQEYATARTVLWRLVDLLEAIDNEDA